MHTQDDATPGIRTTAAFVVVQYVTFLVVGALWLFVDVPGLKNAKTQPTHTVTATAAAATSDALELWLDCAHMSPEKRCVRACGYAGRRLLFRLWTRAVRSVRYQTKTLVEWMLQSRKLSNTTERGSS